MVVVVVILIVLAMVALLVVSTTVLFLVLMVVVAVVVLVALAVVVSVVVAVVVVLVEGLTAVSTLALVLVVLVIFVIDEDLVSDSMNSVLMVGISNVPSAVEDFVVVFSLWCEGVVVVDISGVANVAVRLLNCVGSIADAEFSSNSITDSLFVVFCNGVVGSCNGSLIVVVSSVIDALSDIAVVGNIVVPSNVDEALISSVVSLQMW